jgi:hypothetical protein
MYIEQALGLMSLVLSGVSALATLSLVLQLSAIRKIYVTLPMLNFSEHSCLFPADTL